MNHQTQDKHGFEISAASSLPPVIPDYQLLRCIGRGAYGEVWLACNLTGSLVALKLVKGSAFDHQRPFEREFEGIKRFEPISRSDATQVPILHVGRGEGFFYYVMELADDSSGNSAARTPECEVKRVNDNTSRTWESYVPHTVREDLKHHGRLPVNECVRIGLALTQALAHLHKSGLVHRDVKPSNVIFVGGVPKLADIGLVTSVDATRSLVGTEGYVAPEGPGTPEADLYSLGKLLYELSTGCDRKQFPALPPDILLRADRGTLVELNAVVTRACQFDPRDRYQTAEAMHGELALLARGQSVLHKRSQQQWRTRGMRVGSGLVGLATLAILVSILVRWLVPSDPYPDGPPSRNEDANRICQKGMDIIRYDNVADSGKAYTNFIKAIELDSRFARPWVGLMEIALREPVPIPDPNPYNVRRCGEKLKELAPGLGATYVAKAIESFGSFDFPAAEHEVRQAISANPKYELGHTWYGFMLTHWGRPKEAREQLQISQKILNTKAIIYRCIGHTYYAERDFSDAIKMYRKALDLDTRHRPDFLYLGRALRAQGDYLNGLKAMESADLVDPEDPDKVKQRYRILVEAFKTGGAPSYWQQEWNLPEHKANGGVDGAYEDAVIQINLGQKDAALDSLERTWKDYPHLLDNSEMYYLLFDEHWDGLRENPRFRELLKNARFIEVMSPTKN